ncbi:MAG TPA: sigma-70 family RNA polymerase sigma factor, partial [Thermoanaerobaculia bacterium]|nr:sigma-70 family RNA polymerase sigma factor [Thermoanaerobaculia bacterium]
MSRPLSESDLRALVAARLAARLGVDPGGLDLRASFHSYGLDSAGATGLIAELAAELGRTLSPTLIWSHPTPEALARFLAGGGARDADVDDLVQETFIRAFRAVGKFRGQCQFRTWLLTIGGNVLKDAGRRAARDRVVPLDDALRDRDGDPHEQAVAGEAADRLQEGLARLPRMQREVFLLRAQQGLAYEEIAAALGTSAGAARVHYHHA